MPLNNREENNKEEKILKCPHCQTEIEKLLYNTPVAGTEYGIVYASISQGNEISLDEWETEEQDCDSTGNSEFECIECGRSMLESDIIIETKSIENLSPEKPKEFNEDGKEIKKIEEKINPLIAKRSHTGTYNDCIICPKCKKINIIDIYNEKTTCGCTHCKTTIIIQNAECLNNE